MKMRPTDYISLEDLDAAAKEAAVDCEDQKLVKHARLYIESVAAGDAEGGTAILISELADIIERRLRR
jgi:hypothetical protein